MIRPVLQCELPATILGKVGGILCAPALLLTGVEDPTYGGDAQGLRRAVVALLAADCALLLVIYSGIESVISVALAKEGLPPYLRTRLIGSIGVADEKLPHFECQAWHKMFSPRLPLSILDDTTIQKICAVSLRWRRGVGRKEALSHLRGLCGLSPPPQLPVLLEQSEIFDISLEAYAYGLSSLSYALQELLMKRLSLKGGSDVDRSSFQPLRGDDISANFRTIISHLRLNVSVTSTSID